MLKTYILPISERIEETADTLTFRFAQPKVDKIPYHAGQFLTVKAEIDGKTHWRSYSMSSTPRLDDFISITVKKLDKGLVSQFIHQYWKEGNLVEFIRPSGRFSVTLATKHRRHLMLWAGGSGITPLFSIMKGILFHEPYSQVSLFYVNRNERSVIFRSQITAFKQKFPQRLRTIIFLTRPDHLDRDQFILGRPNPDHVKTFLAQQQGKLPVRHYLCGPEGLMKLVREGLKQSGVDEKTIFQEKFVADESIQKAQQAVDGPTRTVKIDVNGETHQIRVPFGATILDAAAAQGLDLPFSCKRGICATCMGRILEGKVDMEDPEALLEFEIEAGKILVCQAHPSSENLHIRIGF